MSLRLRRALGLLVIAVWTVLLYGLGEWAYQREMRVLQEEARGTLEVQSLSLRGVAQRYKHIPHTSAQQDGILALLKSPDSASLINDADRYLNNTNRRVGSEALYLMDAKGLCIAASNWNEVKPFKGDNYGFRPYFKQARAGGLGMDYAVGTTTGLPGLFYASPVQDGDTIHGVMAIKVVLTEVEKNWAQAPNPVFLLDRHGIVVLSSLPAYLYTAARRLGEDEVKALHSAKQYGTDTKGGAKPFMATPWEIRHPPGEDYRVMVTTVQGRDRDYLIKEEYLPEFDWTLMVTANLAPARQVRWIAITIGVLASVTLLFGGLYWRQRERRVLDLRQSRRELESRVRERTQDLAERDAFRKAMEDSLLVGMRARDLDGRVTYVNPALCDITGYSAQDLLGRMPPYPYWHPEEFEKHWHDNDLALKGQAAPTGYESRFRHALGHDIFVMVYTAPLIDAIGKHSGWMSSMVDITIQKKAEEAQRNQSTQMQSSARLAIVGEMASTLAHELGNPLMAITSDASTARVCAERGQRELLFEALGNITTQAQRAAEIVRRIRGFVRQNTPGFQDCSVNALVNNVMSLLRPELRHQRAKALVRLTEDLPVIQADPLLLEQVILNLVVNAAQAMHDKLPRDKVVVVETGAVENAVFVRISDQGPGISADVAQQLFTPFFTTKPEGLGLGLNICRTIVESHQGRLIFNNRPDGGAAFTVYLPVHA